MLFVRNQQWRNRLLLVCESGASSAVYREVLKFRLKAAYRRLGWYLSQLLLAARCHSCESAMHKSVLSEKTIDSKLDQAASQATNLKPGRIMITRDDHSNEWVIELGPGLDLLEIVQVLNQVQHQAIELLQEQIADATLRNLPIPDDVDQSLRDTVTL